MKCPKCGEELDTGMRFCTRCGVNVDEAIRELAERIQREEEEKRLEEERKKIEEQQKEENLRREAERIEKEKQRLEEEKRKLEEDRLRAVREAEELQRIREENAEKEKLAAENAKKAIEISNDMKEVKPDDIIENKKEEDNFVPVNNNGYETGFKPTKSPKKVYRKKGFFSRLIDRLILIIILAIIIVGGIYYLNLNGYLPEELSKEINSLIDEIKDVKSSIDGEYKKDKKSDRNDEESKNDNSNWKVENNIEADDIFDLDNYVSGIIVDGKYGIIDNDTGKILLDTKYDNIKIESNKIIVQSEGKYYFVDSKYQLTDEVVSNVQNQEEIKYVYNTEDENIYVMKNEHILEEFDKSVFYTDDNIVVQEASIDKDDITEANSKKSVEHDDVNFSEKYGIYNPVKKEMIVKCEYLKIFNYSEDLAAAKSDTKAGFIDKEGKQIKFDYEETRSVHSGYAFVKLDGKWGIIKVNEI